MSNPKLLLVDDEPNILKSLKRLLRSDGYEIFMAESGAEGLKIMSENPDIQVIVSDQRMPHMSGSEFLNEVKSHYPKTVRMILSGYADFDAVVNAINDGKVYKFLSKPWEDDELKQEVKQAFSKASANENSDEQTASSGTALEKEIDATLEAATHENKDFGLIIVDIDHFEALSSVFGQDKMAKVVDSLIGKIDRNLDNSELANSKPRHIEKINANTFGILMDVGQTMESMTKLTKRALDFLQTPTLLDGQDMVLQASVGGYLAKSSDESAKSIIRRAMVIVHNVKETGRNNFSVGSA